MFLRKTSRFKDGKRHDYWSVAENARAGARVVQRQLLYLGEIDEDRQNAWLNAIDELEERKAEDAASYLIPPQPEQKRRRGHHTPPGFLQRYRWVHRRPPSPPPGR